VKGRSVSPGRARGPALVSRTPLGFYGGVDPETGVVVEKGHELEGRCVKDTILVFPGGKGSTVGSYVIYALARKGTGPLAIVNERTEIIVATGAILAGIPCVDGVDISAVETGDLLEVDADEGTVDRV
jgi:predicted aconitase with swiveling domain